ncbi:acyl-CoA dehydrogenase family protein [Janibacter limosus]|uniref:acyl-CoA dehydrogenase family protein n=1 Tax=Janibacter limosus TaxID=53458 RepID=UPI00082CCBB1|nr:acyl-CoA dehydrogenase family protein [Janibacter limosus]
MEHDLSPEANELRDMVRTFLERKAPESAVRTTIEAGHGRDEDVWTQMAGQLGLQGLLVPEDLGGQGTTPVEMGVVLEEIGRALLPSPFVSSSVIAVSALIGADDTDASGDLLRGLADGSRIATVAFSSGLLGRDKESTVAASEPEGGWQLSGEVAAVLDAGAADTILVFAPTLEGTGLFAVEAAATERTPLTLLDLTRQASSVRLVDVPATRIGGEAGDVEARVLATAAAALCAESAGAAQRVLEMAVEHAKVREQFGKPIGAFQAVKHLCADIFTVAESATAVARHAARSLADQDATLGSVQLETSLAKAYVSEHGADAAEKNIQVHGGIGYTWEHPAHLYLRKLKSNELLFGDAVAHRAQMARVLGLKAPAAPHDVVDVRGENATV